MFIFNGISQKRNNTNGARNRIRLPKDFYKMMAYIVYTGASLTAVGFNNPKQFPSIEQAFPNLFEREEQQDCRLMKQRVTAFTKAKNPE